MFHPNISQDDWWKLIVAVAGAIATGATGMLTGEKRGVKRGRTEFLDAVERAASLVIENLTRQHEDCHRQLSEVRQELDGIRSGAIAVPLRSVGDHTGGGI